jgi:hypothetical protein
MDWRDPFASESRSSFDAAIAVLMEPDAYSLANRYRMAWRYDSTIPDARRLERHFAETHSVQRVAPSRVGPDDRELSQEERAAIGDLVVATRAVLAKARIAVLTLYRGQPVGQAWALGDSVSLTNRGLTAWTPDAAIAYAHAARRTPGAVLETEAPIGAVAMAFDPASDGEIVLAGDVEARVSRLAL